MKYVILDRDGVINHDSDHYIKNPDEWTPIEGSLQAIARLTRAGYHVYIATNQSGLGRGLFEIETLHAIHQKMNDEIKLHGGAIEAIVFCPHTPEDRCQCRKPAPGLLLEIEQRAKQPLVGVPFIGDTLKDIQAARSVDARPILVRTGKGNRTIAEHGRQLRGVPIHPDLSSAVDMLLREEDEARS